MFVVLPKVPSISDEPVCVAPPVIPTPVGVSAHEYVVPVGITPWIISVGTILNGTPLQLVTVIGFTEADGLTVITTVNVLPAQPLVSVDTTYVTDCAVLVVLSKVPFTLVWLTAPAIPVRPVADGADQLYNVPVGTIPLVTFDGVTVKLTPSQAVAVMPLINATGLTVTVSENTAPAQPPVTEVGVIK